MSENGDITVVKNGVKTINTYIYIYKLYSHNINTYYNRYMTMSHRSSYVAIVVSKGFTCAVMSVSDQPIIEAAGPECMDQSLPCHRQSLSMKPALQDPSIDVLHIPTMLLFNDVNLISFLIIKKKCPKLSELGASLFGYTKFGSVGKNRLGIGLISRQ